MSHHSIPMDTLAPSILTGTSKEARGNDTQKQCDSTNQGSCVLGKTPTPIYRHAAPSGPWPWMDFDEDVLVVTAPPTLPTESDRQAWNRYPQSSFPNWTDTQVNRCKMLTACPKGESKVFKVDVFHNGTFSDDGDPEIATIKDSDSQTEAEFWDWLQGPREENIRVRSLFVKNMTKEVLRMLGAKYVIEPFFFSSSANWIPSRYQENLIPNKSDHITIVLPFVRVIDKRAAGPVPSPPQRVETRSSQENDQVIDTQSPLYLDSHNKYILQDLLSVHMVRAVESSTIISCHPELRRTTAEQLRSLINRTGRSVYWQKIFQGSKDPTCLYLCFLWYAMYQWDEVFEILYAHINWLEQKILSSDNIRETRDLHILQAHLLYYRTLLEDFRKSVLFVQETANPAMQDPSVTPKERAHSKNIMKKETEYLLSEIERLESQRKMQVMRLKNVIDLAFASVNIDDSKYMKELTVATVRDSAAMKQISYLTMVFLPANFMANLFSMNVVEINPGGAETVAHYVEGVVGLTLFTAWIAIALQVESHFFPLGSNVWRRVGWPMYYVWDCWLWVYRKRFGTKQKTT